MYKSIRFLLMIRFLEIAVYSQSGVKKFSSSYFSSKRINKYKLVYIEVFSKVIVPIILQF